jgi:adenylate cyclase
MPNLFFRDKNRMRAEPNQSSTRSSMTDRLFENRRVRRRLQVGLVIGVAVGSLVAIAASSGSLNPYEPRFEDIFYNPRTPSGQVVLIAVDDKTVDDFGWPIERATHGAFLYALLRGHPKVVVLDFVLPDATASAEDTFFAEIIQRAGKVVQPVLGIEATRYPPLPHQFPAFDSVLKPVPVLRTPNTTLAHDMIYPDPDGVVRRVPLAIDAPGTEYPALGLAAVALYQNRDPAVKLETGQVVFGDTHIPVDDSGQMLINYSQRNAIKRISYTDIAQGKADYGLLEDKIVLVGPITKGVPESYSVPFAASDAQLYDVEIQANVIETLLGQFFLREQDNVSRIALILVVSVIGAVSLIQFSRIYAAVLAIIYFGAFMVYAFWRFDSGIILAPLDIILVLLLLMVLTMLYRYFAEERTRALIARLFLGTVAPESVEEVLALYDRGALSLTGGRMEVSVLSITLRGLAPLSEASAPEAVLQVMNEYSARIFEIVFRHGGSIYSEVANTIIAMWNMPLSHTDHAIRAIRAALEIRQQLIKMQGSASEQAHVESGLGVATGPVVAGRLTASARAEYSIIGDVVNLAERLSILATPNRIYIDNATREQANNGFESQKSQAIHIRGKKDPVQSWELEPLARF